MLGVVYKKEDVSFRFVAVVVPFIICLLFLAQSLRVRGKH
jgi:hypothetical protein